MSLLLNLCSFEVVILTVPQKQKTAVRFQPMYILRC
uniref:Uncharacterized protein n=1 Tax=Anguilla anguilla TaxID=7936 RepID=A0A0E9QI66_ANGAN